MVRLSCARGRGHLTEPCGGGRARAGILIGGRGEIFSRPHFYDTGSRKDQRKAEKKRGKQGE